MNKRIPFVFVSLIICLGSLASTLQAQHLSAKKPQVEFRAGQLLFEANHGQAPSEVRFLARSRGFNLYLTDTGALVQLQERSGSDPVSVSLKFTRGDGPATLVAEDERSAKVNYFYGADPQRWLRGLPTYGRVRFRQSQGDIVLYGNENQLEYDLILPAGADPDSVHLRVDGADRIKINDDGDLVLATEAGDLLMRRPVTYQETNGKRVLVQSSYTLISSNEVGFQVAAHDRSKPLTIDPVVIFSTYLGGELSDFGTAMDLDPQGNIFVTGRTSSVSFPTLGGFVSKVNSGKLDVFVAKLSPSGQLVYSTYFGGSDDDSATGIKVNAAGFAFISGISNSADLPRQVSSSRFSGTFQGFIASFTFVGDLVFSTYLSDVLTANGITVDSAGNTFVVGSAQTPGNIDGVLVKLNSTGSVTFRTQIGGSGDDSASAVALDTAGAIHVAGVTFSDNLQVRTPFQTALAGGSDCFVAVVGTTGIITNLSYLGGVNDDTCDSMIVDGTGTYLSGATRSPNFPILRAAQSSLRGPQDIFITKMNVAGSALVYSTFIGGNGSEVPGGLAVDSGGAAYASGRTSSTDLFTVNVLQATNAGATDAFTVKLDSAGALVAAGYVGGSLDDFGNAIDVDAGGNVYLLGSTQSTDFPTAAALQGTLRGGFDLFLIGIPETEFRPRNDDFANATPISGSSGTVNGNNVGATFETKETAPARAGRTSVWWRWTAPFTGTATIDTIGSEFDTVLGIFRGADLGNLTTVASDDDAGGNGTSLATFGVSEGVTYYASVNGFNSASGKIVLHWSIKPPPITGAVNIQGFGGTVNAGQQSAAQIVLANAYPLPITGQLTMTFVPAAGIPAADPAMQFLTGGTTVSFTIAPLANQAIFPDGSGGVAFQTGTVAGTITFTVSLQSSGENITPATPPRATTIVNSQAPSITGVTINNISDTAFEVVITGYSSIREVSDVNFTFTASTGVTLNTATVRVNVTSVFTQWYQSATSQNSGSKFKLTVPFTLQGGIRAGLSSVGVSLVNRIGTSAVFNQSF